jgi:hypothetical protein
MSEDTFGSDPLATIPADAPETSVREYAAALVRNGLSVDDANKHLAARNAAPLVHDSLEMAEAAKERLLGDPSFVDRYLKGDPGAVAEVTALDLRITKGGGKLTDVDPKAADYDLHSIDYRLPGNAPTASVEGFRSEFAALSAELKLPPAHAQSLVHAHLDAVEKTGHMSDIELEAWAREQTGILESALGSDADAQIKVAETTLRKVSRREMNLHKIVASNGAAVALQLIQQAQHLQATGRE